MSVLSVQSVSYSYKTKYQTVQAVKDVSCDLSAGTFYALVGKSGSGKTTLLSLLAGLDTPQSGDIIVGGQSLREIDVDIYRRKQASVIYQSYNLFPLMTVCENVMYPLKLLRHSDADAKKEAQIALEKVGLGESYWKRLPAMLSGGEQQRVAIARTLAVHAQIILADEPTGNLDTENSTQIIQLLSRLAHEENCCVVVVTHDLEVAKQRMLYSVWTAADSRRKLYDPFETALSTTGSFVCNLPAGGNGLRFYLPERRRICIR